jgi:glycosyltransferase involved in cell wall biosynthesis
VEDLVRRLSKHPMLGKRLFWLEGISDEYLEKAYAASACLIASSEAEGFGLPLVEAARKGLPIIARDIPVFREVAGDYAFYFSGMSPENLAQAVRVWLDLSSRGQAPSSKDMPWLTWKESTAQLLRIVLPS